VFTFTGLIGACGLNEAGIGVAINYLSPLDVGWGRLHSVVVRQILSSRNLAGALVPPVVPPRAGGAHYLVAHEDGYAVSIETTGKRHSVFLPRTGALWHTNHYLAAELRELEFIRETSIGSSLARYAALTRFFGETGDKLNVSRLKELTRNHSSFPQSVCAHAAPNVTEDQRGGTVAAMIHVPAERTMHVTGGCACEHEYHAVTL
jgi:isopenicillin-N N-acyltransferase-like protein